MIKKLTREYGCDAPYCLAKARVETGSMECGTNYHMEERGLEKRKWRVSGFKHYCPKHKDVG